MPKKCGKCDEPATYKCTLPGGPLYRCKKHKAECCAPMPKEKDAR